MAITIGYVLTGILAAAIVFIGARFLVAPRVAAAGYGVLPDLDQRETRAYLSVKGVRDIATGLIVIVLLAAGATHLVGWVMLTATIIRSPMRPSCSPTADRSRSPTASTAARPPSC